MRNRGVDVAYDFWICCIFHDMTIESYRFEPCVYTPSTIIRNSPSRSFPSKYICIEHSYRYISAISLKRFHGVRLIDADRRQSWMHCPKKDPPVILTFANGSAANVRVSAVWCERRAPRLTMNPILRIRHELRQHAGIVQIFKESAFEHLDGERIYLNDHWMPRDAESERHYFVLHCTSACKMQTLHWIWQSWFEIEDRLIWTTLSFGENVENVKSQRGKLDAILESTLLENWISLLLRVL